MKENDFQRGALRLNTAKKMTPALKLFTIIGSIRQQNCACFSSTTVAVVLRIDLTRWNNAQSSVGQKIDWLRRVNFGILFVNFTNEQNFQLPALSTNTPAKVQPFLLEFSSTKKPEVARTSFTREKVETKTTSSRCTIVTIHANVKNEAFESVKSSFCRPNYDEILIKLWDFRNGKQLKCQENKVLFWKKREICSESLRTNSKSNNKFFHNFHRIKNILRNNFDCLISRNFVLIRRSQILH